MSYESKIDLVAYYINLDRAPERRQALETAFVGMPWPLERVAAHDAKLDPQGVLEVRGLSRTMEPDIGWDPYRYRAFTMAEEACFASHMTTLKRFLGSDHAYGLILEDDAVPVADLAEVLENILAEAPPFEILKLEGSRNSGSRLALEERGVGRVAVVSSFRPCACSAGYIVTRSGARKLVDNAGLLTTVYDYYLTNPGLTRARTMHVSPWLIRQADFETQIPTADRASRTSRNPVHVLTERTRRLGMRLALWLDAFRGRPRPLVRAPWGDRQPG